MLRPICIATVAGALAPSAPASASVTTPRFHRQAFSRDPQVTNPYFRSTRAPSTTTPGARKDGPRATRRATRTRQGGTLGPAVTRVTEPLPGRDGAPVRPDGDRQEEGIREDRSRRVVRSPRNERFEGSDEDEDRNHGDAGGSDRECKGADQRRALRLVVAQAPVVAALRSHRPRWIMHPAAAAVRDRGRWPHDRRRG
jgi:hypothetical protein